MNIEASRTILDEWKTLNKAMKKRPNITERLESYSYYNEIDGIDIVGNRADVNKDLKKLKNDIDIFTSRSNQLHKVVHNESCFFNMNSKEAYAHIRALRLQLEISTNFLNDRWQNSDDIINGWERLNACIDDDDDLRDDWHSFMCIMKLKG